jgi:hypothetical protein
MDAIHGFAREGDMANLLKCIENGVSVNLKGGLFRYLLFQVYYTLFSSVLQVVNKLISIFWLLNRQSPSLTAFVLCNHQF